MDARLLLIDAQEDFCNPGLNDQNQKDDTRTGALLVPGAWDDMVRVAAMIERLGNRLTRIVASLDQHHPMAIFHPLYWLDSKGQHPDPFTIITHKDVVDGVWRTTLPQEQQWGKEYTLSLETDDPNTGRKGGRYPLCIWPYHCLIGTRGANLVMPIQDALSAWAIKGKRFVDYVAKGSNYRTEHYSIAKAEVEDPRDPMTGLNHALITALEQADIVGMAGEARSHCFANTVRDVMDNFSDPKYIGKMVLLEDATSDVPTFENLGEEFLEEFKDRGGQISTTVDFLV